MNNSLSDNKAPLQKLILIGASTGGPKAVTQILENLPNDFPATVIVLQHMPEFFIANFAKRLNATSPLTVVLAEAEDILQPGHAYIAPYGFDLILEKISKSDELYRIILNKNNVYTTSPSINATFNSAAALLKNRVLGVILTGMGKDGVEGCQTIKSYGGRTIAQDEASSAVFGMPKSAIAAQVIDRILPIHEIPIAILKEVQEPS
ncbi:CheB methylesterase domain-containing protein [Legionella impletisoli]|uniref:protein-glutamate methylesterase n=1 Tax=Legionella impletisoli TaxID=343510 RepID=A0A917N8P1_9GAMM|nr:CheB methylesterase domain-containing protein [Legionella impletisoli]GGI78173.1 hypothetical protein GCM10007966_03610 [Legionella impletisoli]